MLTKLHPRLVFLQDLYDVLNLRHVCQQLVPRMLTAEQKGIRKSTSGDFFNMDVEDKFLDKTMTYVT